MNKPILMLINHLSAIDISDACGDDNLEVIIEDGAITGVIGKEQIDG